MQELSYGYGHIFMMTSMFTRYGIIIGGWRNAMSEEIRRNNTKPDIAKADTKDILNILNDADE